MLVFNCLNHKAHCNTRAHNQACLCVPRNNQLGSCPSPDISVVTSPTKWGPHSQVPCTKWGEHGNEAEHHQYSVLVANVWCLMHDHNLKYSWLTLVWLELILYIRTATSSPATPVPKTPTAQSPPGPMSRLFKFWKSWSVLFVYFLFYFIFLFCFYDWALTLHVVE